MAKAAVDAGETAEDVLRFATRELADAGIAEPRVDAKALFLAATGWSAETLLLNSRNQVDQDSRLQFMAMVRERLSRKPVSDIVGRMLFYGYPITTSPHVLTPRSDSECLVETALEITAPIAAPHVLDLGTGSGCLAIALAGERHDSRVTAVDISADALAVAARNLSINGLTDRITLVQASFEDSVVSLASADVIVSNPPYIARHELSALDPEVRHHDPMLALDGGADGLDAYRTIIRRAGAEMSRGAWIFVEIGWRQADDVCRLFQASGFTNPEVRTDYSGNDRVVFAQKS